MKQRMLLGGFGLFAAMTFLMFSFQNCSQGPAQSQSHQAQHAE